MSKKFEALKNSRSLHFVANKMPLCPHCGSKFDIAENNAWFLYDEYDTHEVSCPTCDNDFLVNSSASWVFSTDEQDDKPQGQIAETRV